MKKVNFIVAIIINVLFVSCTLEQSLNGSMALIDSVECEDCEPIVSTSDTEYNNLLKNWTNEDLLSFSNPLECGDDIVLFERELISINKKTGEKNWSAAPGYISNYVEPVLVGTRLYVIDDNTIYVFDLNSGENVLIKHWKSSEDISRGFHIFEDVMYVHVTDKNNGYSAFASCALNELSSTNWMYFNRKISANGGPILTQYRDAQMGKNANGDLVIYYIASSRNFTTYTGDTGYKIEAFNVVTQEMEWINDQGLNVLSPNQLQLKEDQIFVRGIDFVLSIDRNTGTENWKTYTEGQAPELNGSNNMLLNGDCIYLISGDAIVTSLNLNTGQTLWTSNAEKIFVQQEVGLMNGSINLLDNSIYYLSNWGHLMEVDLETGAYIKHHDALQFDGGLLLTKDGDFVAKPKFDSGLISFSL